MIIIIIIGGIFVGSLRKDDDNDFEDATKK